MAKILEDWKNIAKVPAQKGFEKNIGTAGLLYANINNMIVVGGGANFPYKSVLDGGEKVSHKDIYLFKDEEDGLKLLDQIQCSYPLSYGLNAEAGEKLYHIIKIAENKSAILEISVKDEKLVLKEIAKIDIAVENAAAEFLDGKIYFGAGNINSKDSNEFYSFDIKDKKLEKKSDFPGEKRNQSISFKYGNKIAVGGGANGENALFDLYSYDIKKDSWEKLSNINIDGENISVLGAQAVKINEDEILIIGGFNKDVWKNAVHSLSTLTGEEKQNFRKKYFTSPAEDFNWNKKMLIYNIKQNHWSSIGELNFNPPCGNAVVKSGDYVYSIMGEIKPGTRTDNIYRAKIL